MALEWVDALSDSTKKMYPYYLERFLGWSGLIQESFLKLDDLQIQQKLEEYRVILMKSHPISTVRPVFYAIKRFLIEYDRNKINFQKIQNKIRDPTNGKKSGGEGWTTEHIQSMLKIAKTPKVRALIHLMASTACRVGAIPELKLKHVSEIENCKAILFYPDTDDEYFGFLTPEASQVLDEYLTKRENDGEILTKESPLFRQTYQNGKEEAKPLSKQSIQVHIAKTIKHLRREKKGNRYNIQLDHGFRKRWNSIAKSNDSASITWLERLLGHSVTIPLDQTYISNNKENLKKRTFEEFKKHIANLTIDPSERNKIELSQKEAKITELEAKQKEIDDIKFQLKTKENEGERNQTNMKTMIDEVVFLRGMVEEIAYNIDRKEDEANNVIPKSKEKFDKGIEEYKKKLIEKMTKDMGIESIES